MNITQEFERLGKLHSDGTLSDEEFTKAKSRLLSAPELSGVPFKSIRRRSSRMVCGLPLWAIAIGPDLERGEMRGHARAIFAVSDIATGWFAFGGFARGIFAFGGLAIGLVAIRGLTVGVLVAIGGLAIVRYSVWRRCDWGHRYRRRSLRLLRAWRCCRRRSYGLRPAPRPGGDAILSAAFSVV
jgi:hypothetical protein